MLASPPPPHSSATDEATSPSEPDTRRRRTWPVAGGVLLVALGSVLLYAFWPVRTGEAPVNTADPADGIADAAAHVEVVIVHPADFPLRAEATGHLTPWRSATISAEASGLVTDRFIEEGQRITHGTRLLQLDDRDQQIELREAQAELLTAQAAYAVATSMDAPVVSGDTARLAQARLALQAAVAAFGQGSITQEDLHHAQRRFDTAEILSGTQRGTVQAVTAGLTQAEQRLARADLALSRTRITAPFSGRIADLTVEAGQHVGVGHTVLTLLDDYRMKVAVDVLEADLVQVRRGTTAQVRVPALSDIPVSGTLYAINPRIDPATGTGRVTVALPNPQGRLITGLFAYVALETQRLPDRLVVPADAVLVRQGRDLVFRIEKQHAQWVYVTVGARSGDTVEIVEGLSPGDTVAVAGHVALAHDAPVFVVGVRQTDRP